MTKTEANKRLSELYSVVMASDTFTELYKAEIAFNSAVSEVQREGYIVERSLDGSYLPLVV